MDYKQELKERIDAIDDNKSYSGEEVKKLLNAMYGLMECDETKHRFAVEFYKTLIDK